MGCYPLSWKKKKKRMVYSTMTNTTRRGILTLNHDEVTLDNNMDEIQSVPSTTSYVMDKFELELNDDSNKIEH